jgi:vancomycin permeability regulator SanA
VTGRTFRRGIRIGVLVVLALLVLSIIAIVGDGLTDELIPADVAVVFGNTVTPDGRPTARLQARLDRACRLYRQHLVTHLVVSGGLGREGVDEATVMQRYLLAQGIPADQISVDHQGLTTALTARYTATLMQTHGWQRVIAVTQYFHITRAKLALRQAGIPVVYGAHAEYIEWRDAYATLRDVLGLYAYVLRYGWK